MLNEQKKLLYFYFSYLVHKLKEKWKKYWAKNSYINYELNKSYFFYILVLVILVLELKLKLK